MDKKSYAQFIAFTSLLITQFNYLNASQENPMRYPTQTNEIHSQVWTDKINEGRKKTFYERMKERELKLQVPRETVPVTESNYPISTPIPKTAHYLPFLQTLLHIKPGTLPNPIGVSIIGSYTVETYRVKQFNGQMGANLGSKLGGVFDLIPESISIPILGRPTSLPLFNKNTLTKGLIFNQTRDAFISNLNQQLNSAFSPETKEWKLSDGTINTKTSAVGAKFDVYLLPFMNLFATVTYLHMEQETRVGSATIPLDTPISLKLDGTMFGNNPKTITLNEVTFPVGSIKNTLDGYAIMGGTNVAIGYKGFFASCMVGGGFVQLDDWQNNVKGFVEKPFMYIAPRVGYTYNGVFTMHAGVQRIELFGSTKGKDLSASTGGLVQGYSVELDKFPVNILAGAQFMPVRDFGISLEYVGSPDTSGINAEIAYRF